MLHNVAILWDDLLNAFSSLQSDRVYFLDRATGEIFFLKADLEDKFWHQFENHRERFIEIPSLDYATERQILSGFINNSDNADLCRLLGHALRGAPPYVNPSDIISFFPDEELQLAELKDRFVSDRVRNWLEENNLLSMSASLNAIN